MNVMAATGSASALEKAVDEYQYALSVEWDQKDVKFYDAQTVAFLNKLQTLIKENGVSKNEIMTFAENRMSNKAAVEALKLKLSLLSTAASTQELAALVRENAKDLYAKGASWNGEVVIGVAIVAVIVGVIAYAVWFDATHECVAWDSEYVCHSYGCGGYYGDPYYGGYYGGYGSCGTYCGYEDVCTQYVKK
jgi:hypothetical protein